MDGMHTFQGALKFQDVHDMTRAQEVVNNNEIINVNSSVLGLPN